MSFNILKVCFIAKEDNSNSRFFWQKQITPHLMFHRFNLRWQCRSLTNFVVVVIINCMDMITHNTQSISLTIVTRCFCKVPLNGFSFYFPFSPWRRYHRFIKYVEMIHPRSSFSQFWRNSSQLACLFKGRVALAADLNTARWFAKMDLSASVQKQQRCLSAVKRELAMPWMWTISAFLTKRVEGSDRAICGE